MIDQSVMQEIRIDTELEVVHVGAGCPERRGQVDIATYRVVLRPPAVDACGRRERG